MAVRWQGDEVVCEYRAAWGCVAMGPPEWGCVFVEGL
jgi:hypothetical protein